MRTSRWLRLVGLCGAIVLLLATVTSAAVQGELEIFSWWAGDEGPALEALIAMYEEMYPEVTVINATVTGGAGVNAKAVLKTRMLGGDPPDTFQVHAGQELIGTWVVKRMRTSPGSMKRRLDGSIPRRFARPTQHR